jgi:hypothetical protein
MPHGSASAVEIDRKLSQDFRRRLKDYGISAEAIDPVLAVIFRTFAQEIERIYLETGRIRTGLLDEFLAGLHLEPRKARPAQSIVRFFPNSGTSVVVPGGTELEALASTGERLTFITDAAVRVSNARIAFAATYQDGFIQLLPGVEMPDALQAAHPSLDPVPVRLGPHPAVYLAIEDLPSSHLSHHSISFELGPDSLKIQRALRSEPWCIAGPDGELSSVGILRPRRGNGGIRLLEWLVQAEKPGETLAQEVPELPDGFFSERVFVLPYIPEEKQFTCVCPRGMREPLTRIFGREGQRVLATPRAWVRISLPPGLPALHTGLGTVTLHAVTVSNVECFNQTIQFSSQGTSIPISHEGGTKRHLVSPLAVLGESNERYLQELEPSPDKDVGRYAVRHGRIELRPAKRLDGIPEAYANVRVWVTDGITGNGVSPGQITGFRKAGMFDMLRVANPVPAAGGTDGERFAEARTRFAEALLSRDRIVTEADLVNAVRSFDRRILDAEIHSRLARTSSGLERVQQVIAMLDRDGFTEPSVEVPLLEQELLHRLQGRFLHGIRLELVFEWNN